MLPSLPQLSASDAGIAPIAGMSWSASLLTPVVRVRRFRRPSRAQETSERIVTRAIPAGAERPAHTDEWIEALEAHPVYEQARADRKRALRRCVEALVAVADYGSMTARPTWEKLSHLVEKARRSIARYVQQLREMGLLAVVASGRSAAYAPVGEDGRRVNEAAVYVLCVPAKRSSMKDGVARIMGLRQPIVDESGTPPREAGLRESNKEIYPRTRARVGVSQSEEQKRLGCSVDQIRWNRHRVPVNRPQQLTAAWRLKSLLPNVLGKMSDQDVAACVRDFFNAGWSVADLHHALDSRPDGEPWPYSGAPDTKEPHRVRGWLRFRLAAWRDEAGVPMVSRDQHHRREREKAQRERQAQYQAQQQRRKQVSGDSEIKRRSLAKIRAVLSRR